MATLAGLALGSFGGVIADRLPAGRSIVTGRSACDGCGRFLTPARLVPLLSWLWQRGRCACGRMALSPRYPLYELITGLACLAGWMASHNAAITGLLGLLAVLLVAISAIDLATMRIPDSLTLSVAMLGIAWAGFGLTPWLESLAGGLAAALLMLALRWAMQRLLRRPALGLGDVKLLAACAAWTGLSALPELLMLTGLAGIIAGIAWRLAGRGALFPFGPAIATGCYATLLLLLKGFLP